VTPPEFVEARDLGDEDDLEAMQARFEISRARLVDSIERLELIRFEDVTEAEARK
jgi:hypothetical protein